MNISLSERETQVLNFLWDGLTIKSMASRLKISQPAVYNYTASLREKFEAGSNIEACRKAVKLGMIHV